MKKILVIDDEEWLREMVQMALRQKGFDVVEAENGARGVETALKEFPCASCGAQTPPRQPQQQKKRPRPESQR